MANWRRAGGELHDEQDSQQLKPAPAPRTSAGLDVDTFQRLVDEGQDLRRAFDERTRAARVMTPEDLKIRCR